MRYMRGIRGSGKIMGLFVVVLLCLLSVVSVARGNDQTVFNNLYVNLQAPPEIKVNQGEQIKAPIFFAKGPLTNSGPVDLYLIKYDAGDFSHTAEFLTGDGRFVPAASDLSNISPYQKFSTTDDYFYKEMVLMNNAPAKSFELLICLIGVRNNVTLFDCGSGLVTILPPTTPALLPPTGLTANVVSSSQIGLSWNSSTGAAGYYVYRDMVQQPVAPSVPSFTDTGLSPNTQYCYAVSAYNSSGVASGQSAQACAKTLQVSCQGLSVSPQTVPLITLAKGATQQIQINVNDKCGTALASGNYDATHTVNWITNLQKQNGILTATVDASSLFPNTTSSGTISVSSGSQSVSVNVSVSVTPPSFGGIIGGGGGSCTPTAVNIWPPDAISVVAGQTQSLSIAVKDDCSNNISSYTATTTSSSPWLSLTNNPGNLVATVATTTTMSGTYTATIVVKAAGLSDKTFSLTLNITGQCIPSSAMAAPSPVTPTIVQGQTANGVSVSITDNCGVEQLAYAVSSITFDPNNPKGATSLPIPWLATPAVNTTGTGTMTVSFVNNASQLQVGAYKATITVTPAKYGAPLTVPVTLTVTNTSPSPQPGPADRSITEIPNKSSLTVKLAPGKSAYFSAVARGGSAYALQFKLEPIVNAYYGGDMLIQYVGGSSCGTDSGSVSNLVTPDYLVNTVWPYAEQYGGVPIWFPGSKTWYPPRARDDLYYALSGISFEFATVSGDPAVTNNPGPGYPVGCYYVLVYNGSSEVEQYNVTFYEW